jgi:8-oxo-dGTP pyrophosphatase MutT (NUDIX family)
MKNILAHPDIAQIEKELISGSRELVFFVGAGLSKSIGFPLWHELLMSLITFGNSIGRLSKIDSQEAEMCIRRGEYLKCGQILRDKIGKRLDQKLRELFLKDLPLNLSSFDYLVRLPCAGYITTNYDTAIETAWARQHHGVLASLAVDESRDRGLIQTGSLEFLLKLHGDVARNRFVLSTNDYKELYEREESERFLYGVFFKYKIVFLGYGLSDKDIVYPFQLLSHDHQSSGRRHLALLPDTISSETRRILENSASIDVCLYDPSDDHVAVEQVISKWFVGVKNAMGVHTVFENPTDTARLLQTFPNLITEQFEALGRQAFDWLMSLPTRWGAEMEGSPKAANLAEGVIALAAANRMLGKDVDYHEFLDTLLTFQNPEGGFIAKTLAVPNVQTHALSIYALIICQEYGAKVRTAIDHGLSWLQRSRAADGFGWGRFELSKSSRTTTSVWAFSVLLKLDNLILDDWRRFRDKLIEAQRIDHIVGQPGYSVAAAAWIMWFQAQLKMNGLWNREEEPLLDLALAQVLHRSANFENEPENFLLEDGLERSGNGIWLSWIHSTAPAVILGTLGWIDSRPNAWDALGKAISVLFRHSRDGVDGSLTTSTMREGGGPYVFHTMYGLWAVCECLQRFRGLLINKVGLLTIQDRRVLMVRKRGTHELIVPGGGIETNETAQSALEREIREELGSEIFNVHYWKTFEDNAAFELGAAVRIQAYFGSLNGVPTPTSEIANLFWIDSKFPPIQLSPIVRNKIIPALLKEGLID